jgi:hypothetical protein
MTRAPAAALGLFLEEMSLKSFARSAIAFRPTIPRLKPIAEKVMAEERLSFDDGVDALSLGRHSGGGLAGEPGARADAWQRGVFQREPAYQPHERLRGGCRLCAFGRKKDTAGAYTMALEQAWETAASGYSEAVTEFHIVGGLHPDLPFEYFLDLVSGTEGAVSAGAHQGVHDGRGFVPGEARQAVDRRDAAPDEGCRVSTPARAAARRSSPTACGTSSATTRSMATSGWRRRGRRTWRA